MDGHGTFGVDDTVSREHLSHDAMEGLIRAALDYAFDGVLIHRPDGTLVYWNEAVARELGVEPEQMLDMPPWGWTPADDGAIVERLVALQSDGFCRFTTEWKRPDGKNVPIEVNSRWLETDSGPMIVSITRDITETVAAEKALREMAFRDPLTGLANRAMLEDRLKLAISSAQRHHDILGVLFVDLDDFKPVNDTYGHSAGDDVLKIVAARMLNAVRQEDTVARVGGDEFVIVLPRLRASGDIEQAARKIRDSICIPMPLDEINVCRVTASVGYALFDHDHDDAHSLLIRADLAMYHARQTGGDIAGAEPLE